MDGQSVTTDAETRDEPYDSDDNNSMTTASSAYPTDSPTAKCKCRVSCFVISVRHFLLLFEFLNVAFTNCSPPAPLSAFSSFLKLKAPTWSQPQLREAIHSVITQKLRFTQASSRYNIPKGTLYDNILGKANRMLVLEESGLDTTAEKAVLEFCCDVSVSPYNRRTKKPLATILEFVQQLSNALSGGKCKVKFSGKFGFRWWWAFCKKYSIVSLHYDGSGAAAAAAAVVAAVASGAGGGSTAEESVALDALTGMGDAAAADGGEATVKEESAATAAAAEAMADEEDEEPDEELDTKPSVAMTE